MWFLADVRSMTLERPLLHRIGGKPLIVRTSPKRVINSIIDKSPPLVFNRDMATNKTTTRTETVTPILRDRILGEYELDRGNGMSHRMAYANVLGTVPVVHEKIIEVLREAGISR